MSEIRSLNSPGDIISFLFPVVTSRGETYDFTWSIVAAGFTSATFFIGATMSIVMRSFAPVVIALLTAAFIPMVMNSWDFFNKLFYNWDSQAMTYLSICIGIGILILAIVAIVETPTHGDA